MEPFPSVVLTGVLYWPFNADFFGPVERLSHSWGVVPFLLSEVRRFHPLILDYDNNSRRVGLVLMQLSCGEHTILFWEFGMGTVLS
jgi:hypothetical protein